MKLCVLLFAVFYLSLKNDIYGSSDVDRLCGEIPEDFKSLGCKPTRYIPDKIKSSPDHPILTYDLRDEIQGELSKQYERAKALEQTKGFQKTALSLYWNLAELGYPDANYKLWHIFRDGELGVKPDPYWANVFFHRPKDIREMSFQQLQTMSGVEKQEKWNAKKSTKTSETHSNEITLSLITKECTHHDGAESDTTDDLTDPNRHSDSSRDSNNGILGDGITHRKMPTNDKLKASS